MKCYWINQTKYKYEDIIIDDNFLPIICVSASKSNDNDHRIYYSWDYIAGAGDDDERWSNGLIPDIIYSHIDDIKNAVDPDIFQEDVNNWIKLYHSNNNNLIKDIIIKPLHIYLEKEPLTTKENIGIINISKDNYNIKTSKYHFYYPLECNKKYRMNWRYKIIPDIINIFSIFIRNNIFEIHIISDDLFKLDIGILLILLCNYYDNDFKLIDKNNKLTKEEINNRFCYLQQYLNTVLVPRWIRQSINTFFISDC